MESPRTSVCVAAGLFIALVAASVAAMDASDAPTSDDVTWTISGPGGGGWIQSIAWDPQDPDVLYVGCDVGGFYYSADAGRSYEIRNDGLLNYFVECIAVHPRNSDTILLGTEGGIFRTEDRGLHWQRMGEGFPPIERYGFSAPVGALCFDRADPDVCYAGIGRPRRGRDGSGTILRSHDSGRSWRTISAGQLPPEAIISDIELQPGNSGTILAATTAGVYRSDDGGATWQASSDGLPHHQVREMAFAASEPQVVYLSLRTAAREGGEWDGGVWRSDDAGRTWRPANGPGMPQQLGRPGQAYQMTSGIKEIVVDPRDADVVYAGSTAWVTDGIYKTADGGATWERVAHRGERMDYGWLTQWGPTAQCMSLSPADPDRVAFGTSGHVFVTDDAGGFWDQRYCRIFPDARFCGTGLEVTCLNRVIPDPARAGRAYGCFMDIGLLRSEDAGRTWRRLHEGMEHSGNCFEVLVDPEAPETIWAATGQWGSNVGIVCRSDDDGATWRVVGSPGSGLPNGQSRWLLFDPRSPVGSRRILCTSRGNGLQQSPDGGRTWRTLNGNMDFGAVTDPRALLMDPEDPDHLIAAFGGLPEDGSGVYDSRDGGSTWRRVNAEALFNNVCDLAADPRDFAVLYLAARDQRDNATGRQFAGGLYKTADGGRTWELLLDYHFVDSVGVHPTVPGLLYVGTTDHPYHDDYAAEGVLKSTDGGRTWVKVNDGLSIVNVTSIEIDPHEPSRLYAGTGGNGIFVGRDDGVPARQETSQIGWWGLGHRSDLSIRLSRGIGRWPPLPAGRRTLPEAGQSPCVEEHSSFGRSLIWSMSEPHVPSILPHVCKRNIGSTGQTSISTAVPSKPPAMAAGETGLPIGVLLRVLAVMARSPLAPSLQLQGIQSDRQTQRGGMRGETWNSALVLRIMGILPAHFSFLPSPDGSLWPDCD